jgi:ABC-type anion transport system duplicated permease subunit
MSADTLFTLALGSWIVAALAIGLLFTIGREHDRLFAENKRLRMELSDSMQGQRFWKSLASQTTKTSHGEC